MFKQILTTLKIMTLSVLASSAVAEEMLVDQADDFEFQRFHSASKPTTQPKELTTASSTQINQSHQVSMAFVLGDTESRKQAQQQLLQQSALLCEHGWEVLALQYTPIAKTSGTYQLQQQIRCLSTPSRSEDE